MKRIDRPVGGGKEATRNTTLGSKSFVYTILLSSIPSFWLGLQINVTTRTSSTSNCCPCIGRTSHDFLNHNPSRNNVHSNSNETAEHYQHLLRNHSFPDHATVLSTEGKSHSSLNSGTTTPLRLPKRSLLDPDLVGNMVAGMAVTAKVNFTDVIDLGVPLDPIKSGSSHVLLLYSHENAMPNCVRRTTKENDNSPLIPEISTENALENCNTLNVWLLDHSIRSKDTCWAMVPQLGSYHVQKWKRMHAYRARDGTISLDREQPLRLAPRALMDSGRERFPILEKSNRQTFYSFLRDYLGAQREILQQLNYTISRIVKPFESSTIIVMVCNKGQSMFLVNFVCSARSRALDTSSILVFATDKDTMQVAESLGLAAFYNEKIFGKVPTEASVQLGDRSYERMMLTKALCSQMISTLGYDFLFQDVDIVWYRHPLVDYFNQSWAKEYDIIFQDDGQHTQKFGPYHANSGFYFVRQNDRTVGFLDAVLFSSDIILATSSQQQAVASVLSEHVSQYGMRVKVIPRESWELPTGWHFHRSQNYHYFKNEFLPSKENNNNTNFDSKERNNKSILFHMSWTSGSDDKKEFFEQLGEWFVNSTCSLLETESSSNNSRNNNYVDQFNNQHHCCLLEGHYQCHYRDKPSLRPCRDFPSKDGGQSFW